MDQYFAVKFLLMVSSLFIIAPTSMVAFLLHPSSTGSPRSHHHNSFLITGLLLASRESESVLTDEYCPMPPVLPVFPLRKSVKLPTEELTLNLCEPRYLAMCDFILSQPQQQQQQQQQQQSSPMVFGAIYGSDKPQIVAGGVSPIVPLFEQGDIGTIFSVETFQDGWRSSQPEQRRVRIEGNAIGRFAIQKILHNGYGGVDDGTSVSPPLPFILVEPRLVSDAPIPPGSVQEGHWQTLQKYFETLLMESDKNMKFNAATNFWSSQIDKENEMNPGEGEDVLGDTAATSPGAKKKVQQFSSNDKRTLKASEFLSVSLLQMQRSNTDDNCNNSIATINKNISQDSFRELFSFAAALTLLPERLPRDMQTIMQMTSTSKRMEFLKQALDDVR